MEYWRLRRAMYSRNGWSLRGAAELNMMSPRVTYTPPEAAADPWPQIPDRIDDLGIPRALVTDLILRYLWLHGSGTLASLTRP